MEATVVFISHASEDKAVALLLKEFIEEAFAGSVSARASADYERLRPEGRRLEETGGAIRGCAVELVLCSPAALRGANAAFEAGAARGRGVPVMVLGLRGVDAAKLPEPLRSLRAADPLEPGGVGDIVSLVAGAAGMEAPPVDAAAFAGKLRLATDAAPKLEIISALYGTGDSRVDVTFSVRHHVGKEGLMFLVSDSTLSTQPAKGRHKDLIIRYALSGVEDTIIAKEGEVVKLRLRGTP